MKIQQWENCKFLKFNHKSVDSSLRNAFEYLQIIYISQKQDSLTYIFAIDSMGLRLLLITQLSLKTEPSESEVPA